MNSAATWLTLIGNLLLRAVDWINAYKEERKRREAEQHAASVRSDPASHWLLRFGGKDGRTPPSPADDAGGKGD
jgi:hypothetical protein